MTKKPVKKYTPSVKEKYMCAKHKKYFAEKLTSWRKEIIKSNNQSAILNYIDDNVSSADIVDQASSQTEKSVELRSSNRRRKLINKIDNVHLGSTVSTYIKFGTSFGIDVRSSSSGFENLVFASFQ